MNANELKGQVKQVKGSAKSAIGRITGKHSLTAKGKVEKFVGKAQEKLGNLESEVSKTTARRNSLDADLETDL